MKEEDKKRNPGLSDFLKYHKREMIDPQRNAFERNLQKDPFAEEAEEGFSQISAGEAEHDLILLEKKLKVRSVKNRRMIYYRIAASVAVLMVISSVFFLTKRNEPSQLKEPVAQNQTVIDIQESKVIMGPVKVQPEISPAVVGKNDKVSVSVKKEDFIADVEVPEKEKITESKRAEIIARDEAYNVDPYNVGDRLAAPSAAISKRGQTNEVQITDKTDSVINITPPLVALNEVVVTGYGVSKRSKAVGAAAAEQNKAENVYSGYSPPAPVNGTESFDKYIENNIRKPASLASGEIAIVVITFTVTSSGVIENIKVLRSQGQEYSDEAIRLIKEGPAWIPAKENGEKVDDEVRKRITFK